MIKTIAWGILAGGMVFGALSWSERNTVQASVNTQVEQAPMTSSLDFTGQGDTLVIRVSGLVCDLCIAGIEQSLQHLDHVVRAKAMPRQGMVAVELSQGTPRADLVKEVLQKEGYAVHALTLTQVAFDEVTLRPAQVAEQLWVGGASEQQRVMASKEAQQPTCNTKERFGQVNPAFGSSFQ